MILKELVVGNRVKSGSSRFTCVLYAGLAKGGFFNSKSGCVLYADATYTRVYTVCKVCEHFSYLIEKLHREKVITSPNTEEVLSSLVCSTSNIDCIFRDCVRCRTNKIIYKASQDNRDIKWQEWRNSSHSYKSRDGETKDTRRVKKFTRSGSLVTLVN